jgi:hypothetical protein
MRPSDRVVELGCGPGTFSRRILRRLVKEQLKPAASTDIKRINELIGQLDDDNFTVRQQATTELEKLGSGAESALRKAVESTSSAEVRLRAQRLLERLDTPQTSATWARTGRAIEVLEQLRTPESRAFLQTLAEGDPEARLTQEARAALARMSAARAGSP